MKCLICKHGETEPGHTTVTLEREGLILVVRDVPAQVCASCGEAYVDDVVAARLLETAEDAAQAGAEVDIRRYVAA